MKLNIWVFRLAAVVAGLIGIGGYLAAGGSFGSKTSIVFEFGMYPEEFEGCQVEIDGEVVGTLHRVGNAYRNAFKVEEGPHAVRILHPDFAPREEQVEAGPVPGSTMLILDIVDIVDETGEMRPAIGFQ